MEEPKIKRNNGRGERDYEGYPSENAPDFEKIKYMIEIAKQRKLRNHEFLIRIAWGLAVRVGELTNLKVKDVEFKTNEVYLRSEITKGKKTGKYKQEKRSEGYVQILESSLTKALMERITSLDLTPEDYLFCHGKAKKKYTPRRLSYMIHQIGEMAGIPYIHMHLLRHSRAKWLLENGYSMAYVQRFLRHKKAATTQDNYTRYSRDDMRRLSAVGKKADL